MALTSAVINLSGSGQVVAAPGAGFRIRVFGAAFVSRVANDIKFQSASNDLTGPIPCAANGGIAWSAQLPLFVCNINEALNINATVSNTIGGVVQYDIA